MPGEGLHILTTGEAAKDRYTARKNNPRARQDSKVEGPGYGKDIVRKSVKGPSIGTEREVRTDESGREG